MFSEHQESKPENNTAKTGNQVAADEGSDSDAGLPLIAAMFQLRKRPVFPSGILIGLGLTM